MIRALLVDDEPAQARMLRRGLRAVRRSAPGFPEMHIDECRTARAGLRCLGDRHPHVAVIDWGLEDMPGIELCREVRRAGYPGPMIMLTGRYKGWHDECEALAAGFDEFLRKPYDAAAPLWHMVALARRSPPPLPGHARPPTVDAAWAALGDDVLRLSPDSPVAVVFSEHVELTLLEWKLLRALYGRRGRVVDRVTIAREMWGTDLPFNPDKALERHLGELRRKLGDEGAKLVETRGRVALALLETEVAGIQRHLATRRGAIRG